MNYIGKHWRGELSLGMAFGVNIFLVGIALVFAVGLPPALFPKAPPLVFYSVSIFLIANRYLIIFPWQLVGVWRTCNRSIADEKNLVGARIIKGLVVLWICSHLQKVTYFLGVFGSMDAP